MDPAFSNYHALAPLPDHAIQAIMSPGCKEIKFQACFQQTFTSMPNSGEPASTVLPPQPPDAPKAKPVQQALPALPSGAEACGWEDATFSVEVAFTQGILPEWRPPPKPSKTLSQILPDRPRSSNFGGGAEGQYKAKLQSKCQWCA